MLNRLKEIFNHRFWKITNNFGNDLKLIEVEYSTPFVNAIDNIADENTARIFRSTRQDHLNGRFYSFNRPCVVEPSKSYAIVGLNKIVGPSIYAHEVKPSISSYLKYYLFNTGQKIVIPTAILFDGSIGVNYFYFFAEILNKLYVLEKHNIDKTIPIIIGKKIFDTKYFQYLYHNTEIGKWNWLVQQETDFIACNSLYFVHPTPYNKLHWGRTIKILENIKSNAKPFRRLFLTRAKGFSRGLVNTESIMPILNKYGFETVDPGSLSFEAQGKLFSETEIIVALDGAALTNMMFTETSQLRLLDIMPANRTNAQAGYWLGLFLGIKYLDCILGTDMIDSKFEIPLNDFEKAMERLMAY